MNNHNSNNESHDRDSSEGSNDKTGVAAIAGMGATTKAAMAGVNNLNGSRRREYHISIKVSGGGDGINGSNRSSNCNSSEGKNVGNAAQGVTTTTAEKAWQQLGQ